MAYAQGLGCRVFFPDYHRLPRYPYPAAREDALQAYRFLCLQGEALGIRTDRIAVAGDSAGAVLATYVAGHPWGTLPAPCGQMLVYPVTDASQSTPSIRAYPDTPMWNARSNAKM